jgi:hypothetical protein
MKNSKKSFQTLVSKMEPLTENQEGKLKGGFASLSSLNIMTVDDKNKDKCNNNCTVNHCVATACGSTSSI